MEPPAEHGVEADPEAGLMVTPGAGQASRAALASQMPHRAAGAVLDAPTCAAPLTTSEYLAPDARCVLGQGVQSWVVIVHQIFSAQPDHSSG